MSRTVCGTCWCPYDEYTGECACPPPVTRDDDLIKLAQQCGDWNGQTVEVNDVGLARFVALVTERDTALLRQALEALMSCNSNDGDDPWYDHAKVSAARAALRERLGETR